MGKGKDKGPEMLTDAAAFAPWDIELNDEITTPLGATVIAIGVKGGLLIVRWPGGYECASGLDVKKHEKAEINQLTSPPVPDFAKDKGQLEQWGYERRPQSRHIQRSIDQRWKSDLQWKRDAKQYGLPTSPRKSALTLDNRPQTVA